MRERFRRLQHLRESRRSGQTSCQEPIRIEIAGHRGSNRGNGPRLQGSFTWHQRPARGQSQKLAFSRRTLVLKQANPHVCLLDFPAQPHRKRGLGTVPFSARLTHSSIAFASRYSFLRHRSWGHRGSGHPDPDFGDLALTDATPTPDERTSSSTGSNPTPATPTSARSESPRTELSRTHSRRP